MSAVATTPAKKFHRNLFSKTTISAKRERELEKQNVPFSFTVDVCAAPSAAVAGALPDTYLFINIPEDVSGVFVTSCALGLRSSSAASSEAAADGVEAATKALLTSSTAAGTATNVNLNLYLLDANRRALTRPVTVATLPIAASSASTSTAAISLSCVKMSMPLNAKTSVMLSPSVADAATLATVQKSVVPAGFVLTVTIGGYIIDTEAEEDSDDDGDNAAATTTTGVVTGDNVSSAVVEKAMKIGVQVRRLMMKMTRQSSLTA